MASGIPGRRQAASSVGGKRASGSAAPLGRRLGPRSPPHAIRCAVLWQGLIGRASLQPLQPPSGCAQPLA